MNSFFYKQQGQKDCGPTCLRMVCKYYGRDIAIKKLRELCFTNPDGVNLLAISEAAEKLGFRTRGIKLTLSQLKEAPLPCILHWKQSHFVVLYQIKENMFDIADPAAGLVSLDEDIFKKCWHSHKDTSEGISLLLNPTPQFYEQGDEQDY